MSRYWAFYGELAVGDAMVYKGAGDLGVGTQVLTRFLSSTLLTFLRWGVPFLKRILGNRVLLLFEGSLRNLVEDL